MLRFLRIEHLAVIEALQVEFEPGLNVLTGETGAGKSMLVEAIGLLMGDRASADLIRTGESSASVQALFDEQQRDLIVRREITTQGRSRAFVDDVLVTAASLKERLMPLVELHGQHEHQTLLDPQSHLQLLDAFAGLEAECTEVASRFGEWQRRSKALETLRMDEREKAARVDLLKFQLGELAAANPREGEDEELDTARRVLANADRLQRLCAEAYGALYDSDEAALAQLTAVWKRVAELASVDPLFQPHVAARDSIRPQLEDLALTLRSYREGIDASPERLQQVEDRLALLERLKRKYGPSLRDVIGRRQACEQELELLERSDESRAGLELEAARARDAYLRSARALSQRRREAAVTFSRRLQSLLGELAMGRAQFEIRFEVEPPEQEWTERGVDIAECFLSANVGEDPRPLAKIASGGELSRVMLAIRTLAAAETPGRTLIFDEIDAGIGGRVADVVGKNLRRLGDSFQVLCITHLPQIAAAGQAHFRITKTVEAGRTRTRVVKLTPDERVEEVARMIGGEVPTNASRAAARELLAMSETKPKGESESPRLAKAKPRR